MTRASMLGVACALAVVCGCAGRARVYPKMVRPGTKPLDRTVVFVPDHPVSPKLQELFKTRLVLALGARGVTAKAGAVDGRLALERPPSIAEQVKAFRASTVLVLAPNGGLVEKNGMLVSQYYRGQLIEVASKQEVWRAFVEWSPGDENESSADTLIAEFLGAFEVAGLVSPGPEGPIPEASRSYWEPR